MTGLHHQDGFALLEGAASMGVILTEVQVAQLLEYVALIQKWNQVYNLTALRVKEDMLTHHILDSLAVVSPLQRYWTARVVQEPQKLMDVGSGAGLPGVVIATCFPNVMVTCVDAVAKKATFIQQVAIELGLQNLKGRHSRVEVINDPYDIVISRAFSSLADFVKGTANALTKGGIWLAMKGKTPMDEMKELSSEVDVFHVEQLSVPSLQAERCLIWMRAKNAT